MRTQHTLEVADSLGAVSPSEWDRLAGANPLVSHAFLHAMHESGSASPDSGWAPQYLLLREGATLAAALPLYLKSHSYGEYVFDWAWADAWQRAVDGRKEPAGDRRADDGRRALGSRDLSGDDQVPGQCAFLGLPQQHADLPLLLHQERDHVGLIGL